MTVARTVTVAAATGSYPVSVGAGLLDDVPGQLERHAPAHRYAIISDAHVASLYGSAVLDACRGAGLRADLFTFPRGEAHKTRKHWSILTDALLDAGVGRDAAVVAVGGGVTGDLAGFVAATFMRGIPVVQVPTSLVAMIDASVGGKTGVDVRAGKNLVGAFHPPRAVIVDPLTVRTLDREDRAQGWAEALKHGAILDRGYFDALVEDAEALLDADPERTERAVIRSVELKAGVVAQDERERGRRQILNFGHTVGHALEAASDYALGHGSAVAAGMVLEARMGERMGVTAAGTAATLAEGLSRYGLSASVGASPGSELALYLARDKKARRGAARYVLLDRLGACAPGEGWSHEVPDAIVTEVLATRG